MNRPPMKIAGIMCATAVLATCAGTWPYLMFVAGGAWQGGETPPSRLLVVAGLLALIAVGVTVTYAGLLVAGGLDLGAKMLERAFSKQDRIVDEARALLASIFGGAAIGVVGLTTIALFFLPSSEGWWQTWLIQAETGIWSRLAVAIQAGVGEELLYRLLLLSLLLKVVSKLTNSAHDAVHGRWFWLTNTVVALVFGLAHLPGKETYLTMPLAAGVVSVNAAAGLLFGGLYRTFGIELAIIAHFTADVVTRVMGPSIIRG